MTIDDFKKMLAVQTTSRREASLVVWLVRWLADNVPTAAVAVDKHGNLYVTKGTAAWYPCLVAHTDSVQPFRDVLVESIGERIVGYNRATGRRCGLGADDKAGIFVCLNLLEHFAAIKVALFTGEEIGCLGAKQADASFFENVGYIIEYDCPSRNMLSYSCGGTRLFESNGAFIKAAHPVLKKHGTTLWQDHPYTDVKALRKLFPISCLNLSCGYYNWHKCNEFVSLSDVNKALDLGTALLARLGNSHYPCPIDLRGDVSESLVAIGELFVPEPPPF